MHRLSVVIEDKFAFVPIQVKSESGKKWIWLTKYTEVYIKGSSKNYKDVYLYNIGHDEDTHKELLSKAYKDEEKKKSVKPPIKQFKNILISSEFYNYLYKIDSLDSEVIYTVHAPNSPRQIIYVPTERAIYNVFGAEPGDLVLEETVGKMYKVYKVDMVTMKEHQILNVTYQYMSDGTRDSILF